VRNGLHAFADAGNLVIVKIGYKYLLKNTLSKDPKWVRMTGINYE